MDSGMGLSGLINKTFPVVPRVPPEIMCENMRSALSRGLPEVKVCKPHGTVLSVAGGGPSLDDTWPDLTGYIAAVNGSLQFLLDRGVVPNACAVLDPGDHMAGIVAADPRVRYFVASICHPSVFDKLKGCHVELWHPSGEPSLREALDEHGGDWLMIGGAGAMGVRWLDLGYVCGFRNFHLHGLDSSFRGNATHSYPDHQDGKDRIEVEGRVTRLNFLLQADEFMAVVERFKQPQFDPISIEVFGDGLLQDRWKRMQE
jgi:hypothetical protein